MLSKVLSRAIIFSAMSALAMSVAPPAEAKDQLVGKTYAEAQGKIAEWNGAAVVASVVGDVLERDKCIVTSWRKTNRINASGYPEKTDSFMLNLNCNLGVAGLGPGNSITTPEGKAAKSTLDKAAALNENPAWCDKSDKNHEYCTHFCTLHGDLCTFSVS